ncbi:MAG: glycosyltransferase family 39 protein, partial [Solirubrobacteraceae bacterium]|nr:glycosyltransferase family 39 protein [Solirubrobacteraceae bacterium]
MYKKLLKYRYEYLLFGIFIVALSLRIITAKSMGWLTDEIFYIDFINQWFLKHFSEYFFQWKHEFYPPMSPEFGNGVLSLWLMLPGMYVASKLGISFLLGARFVNVILGSISCVLIYLIGKNFYNKYVGVLAGWLLATSPAVIAGDASAYLDTTLTLLVLLDVYFLFAFLQRHKLVHLYLIGIVLGLMSIVKLSSIPIIIVTFGFLLWDKIKTRSVDAWEYIRVFSVFVLVPTTLWAGARDIDHITRVYRMMMSETFIGTI